MLKDFKIVVDDKYIQPINEIDRFTKKRFNDRRYFALIYGSLAHGAQSEKSDVDVLICAEKTNKDDVKETSDFIVDLHLKHRFNLDSEIDYQNKVLKDYTFMTRAVAGQGFMNKNRKYYLPTIIKTPEYLNSEDLLLRFFLGALAHKHIFFSGNERDYHEFLRKGRENLLKILLNIKGIRSLNRDQLIKEYISHDNITGDYYLGFEDLPYVKEFLSESLSDLVSSLEKSGKVNITGDGYVFSLKWLKQDTEFAL